MFHLVPYSKPGRMAEDNFFRPFFDSDFFSGSMMRVDVRDMKDHYLLEAELPGASQDQIKLSVQENTLTIEANLSKETQRENDRYLYSERRTGHVQRSFTLSDIDENGITAEYKQGVLFVTLPKSKQPENTSVRSIPVQ